MICHYVFVCGRYVELNYNTAIRGIISTVGLLIYLFISGVLEGVAISSEYEASNGRRIRN
jgi:hypothetical protein